MFAGKLTTDKIGRIWPEYPSDILEITLTHVEIKMQSLTEKEIKSTHKECDYATSPNCISAPPSDHVGSPSIPVVS